MPNLSFPQLIGLAGVAPDETPAARQWAQYFEAPMIVIAFWVLGIWYVERRFGLSPEHLYAQDAVIWVFFFTECLVLTTLVRNKWRYLISNWVNVLIIVFGIGILWGETPFAATLRSLRLLLVLGVLLQTSSGFRRILARNHLGSTLAVSIVITVLAGIMMAGIDPGIHSVTDGIWWAWVTVTTVGYGDVVPVTVEGKLFGALLIAMGIGLFSLITASFTVYFVAREEAQENSEFPFHPVEMEERLNRIEAKLDRLLREQQDLDGRITEKEEPPSGTA